MATLSLCMRDDLKQKVQQLAKEQGVSLNGFVNACDAQLFCVALLPTAVSIQATDRQELEPSQRAIAA